MPLTIGCPNCPTKLKVPDNAGGRKVKCPKCGWVLTVPSGTEPQPPAREVEHLPPPPHTPEPPLTPPPPAKPHDSPPPVRARRRDDDDVPAAKATRPARHRDDEDRPARRKRDDEPTDDSGRLHKGWKAVALGYRMFGLAMLFALFGVPTAVGSFIAAGGVDAIQRRPHWYDLFGEKEVGQFIVPLAVAAGTTLLIGLLTFLGHIFLLGMPRVERGGKGKGLAVVMFISQFLPGLNLFAALVLLPIFSGGIGTALNKPKLRKYGFGLFVWYVVGFVLLPLLAGGAFVGVRAVLAAELNGMLYAALGAGVIALVLGLFVFFSVWGTFVGMRRGIQASIRERGVIGGEDPKPANQPKGKQTPRDQDEDDEDALEPAPRAKQSKTDRDESDDRPKKRKRDDDEDEDDRPRKRR